MPLKRLRNLNGTERTDNSKTTAKQKRQAARQLNLKQPIPRQQTTKAVTYNEWPKIMRDTLFIFRCLSYVTALQAVKACIFRNIQAVVQNQPNPAAIF